MKPTNRQIETIIKEKFEHFAPPPPESVWQGIEASLDAQATGVGTGVNKRLLYGSFVAITILLLGWFLLENLQKPLQEPDVTEIVSVRNEHPDVSTNAVRADQNNSYDMDAKKPLQQSGTIGNTKEGMAGTDPTKASSHCMTAYSENANPLNPEHGRSNTYASGSFPYTSTINKNSAQTVDALRLGIVGSLYSKTILPKMFLPLVGEPLLPSPALTDIPEKQKALVSSRWRAGVFVSPEFTLNAPDSLTVLQAYAVHADFRYTANKGFFVKFAAGVQYARDRFFVHVRFNSWDFLGSYDDVYDVTFDTTSGTPIPIYHTQKVDVYDSILHVKVSEATGRYLYFQVPLLAGYTTKLTNRWNWYVYGGPSVNFLISQSFDYPKPPENSGSVYYEINSYQRNTTVYQFWFGSGFEYNMNGKMYLALEPGYRYYFNPVYKDFYKKQSLSAFALRLGITLKL